MLVIKVTQEDIDNGIKKDFSSCPIALAFKRQMKPDGVSVGRGWLKWTNGGWKNRYGLSIRMNRFIDKFDGGGEVKPTTFYLFDFLHRAK